MVGKSMSNLLLSGTPCPECGEPYHALPYCNKCDWYDKECNERDKERIKLLRKLYNLRLEAKAENNPREYQMTERLLKQRVTMKKELTCLVCEKPINVGDWVKAGYGYRGSRRGVLRHLDCLVTERRTE